MAKKKLAEYTNYWRSSRNPAEYWIDKAVAELKKIDATIKSQYFGDEDGKSAYVLTVSIEGNDYRIVWPVMPCEYASDDNRKAARVQAATMIYHDIKARCISSQAIGIRTAFMPFLVVNNGKSLCELDTEEIVAYLPALFL
ncbi:MAG: hypothetical protein AB9888_15510 [Bacteroidales bacterium]